MKCDYGLPASLLHKGATVLLGGREDLNAFELEQLKRYVNLSIKYNIVLPTFFVNFLSMGTEEFNVKH